MNTRTLGADLTVSAVGLGCMGFSHAYGAPTERSEAARAIRAAYDMGYTLFDTAETYGTAADPHENEKLVGEALKDVRDKVQIVTKFGIRFDETSAAVNKPLIPDARPETIRASVEGSLRRLQTDHIDLYFQHRMDPNVEPEAVAQVMADLMKEGKITHWGISEVTEDYLRRAHAICPVTAVQNRYSMMARWHEALFPVLEELNVGFMAFSPMANGLLTGAYGKDSKFDSKLDYRSAMPQFTPEAAEENRELLRVLDVLAKETGTPPPPSSPWPGCCAKSRTLFPSPAAGRWSGCGRTPGRRKCSCPPPRWRKSTISWIPSPCPPCSAARKSSTSKQRKAERMNAR